MQTQKFKLKGTAPLLMHAATTVDPFHALTREMKAITSKRKKTDEDQMEMRRIEWLAGLYFDDDIGPFIPGENIMKTIQEAARLNKRGKDVERALQLVEMKVPLEYKGPRDRDALYADGRFIDWRPVGVQRNKVMRCRPMFLDWGCEFTVLTMPDVWNRDDVTAVLDTAGKMIGLCDYRPRWGRFEAHEL